MIINDDVLKVLPTIEDNSQNLIFSDPPYNLGSVWQISDNGKVDVQGKAVDFMGNKWEGLSGEQLEIMFNEFFRVLKYGGFCCLWSLQRQHLPSLYYANKAGFEQLESVNSFFLSSFPKSLNISKKLDSMLGMEREVVSSYTRQHAYGDPKDSPTGDGRNMWGTGSKMECKVDITAPASDIAKKYDGEHSSICPLKQVNEVLLIFRKPFKHKTICNDILSKEQNNETDIHGHGIQIDKNRVPIENLENEPGYRPNAKNHKHKGSKFENIYSDIKENLKQDAGYHNSNGRYPSNLYLQDGFNYTPEQIKEIIENNRLHIFTNIGIDIEPLEYMTIDKQVEYLCNYLDKFEVSKILDEQSGELKSGGLKGTEYLKGKIQDNTYGEHKGHESLKREANSGGSSRILHKCKYELEEFDITLTDYEKGNYDIYNYSTKVNSFERSIGCENIESVERFGEGNYSQSPVCSICKKTINGTNNHTECERQDGYKIEYVRKEKNDTIKNDHATLKSMKLNEKLLNLFVPEDKKDFNILIPFCGVLSEYIPAMSLGIPEENITGIEINERYCIIGEARKKYWSENDFYFKLEKKEFQKKKKEVEKKEKKTKIVKKKLF